MLTKQEALDTILAAAPVPTSIQKVPAEDALGRVLAQDAVSDISMPPFEKSSMDGWAVRAADLAELGARLLIKGRIMAGHVPQDPIGPGETMKVMTGAPLPEGADSVVMVEDSEEESDGSAVTLRRPVPEGSNVCHEAEDLRAGDTVLCAGTFLDAPTLSLLAMIGVDPVPTWAPPTVAVIPTGDELVPASGPPPGPGMIRESNGVLLAAQVASVSPALHALRPGIARDDVESLNRMLDVGLGHDLLCISGGVSMGDLDLVGRVLKERGLEVLVEKVAIKPGKPLLFGRVSGADRRPCHVFGLPGNPVSSFVTFELFVRPFLLRALGLEDVAPDVVTARLETARPFKSIPRTQHVPAVVRSDGAGLTVTPIEWHGSADLRGQVDANGFILIDAGAPAPEGGGPVRVQLLPGRSFTRRGRPSRGND